MNALLESSMPHVSVPSSSEALPQGARRATAGRASDAPSADPEVVAVARRRQFSASQKRALVAEADRCKGGGELGAFMRRERIYSSMLSSWRQQLQASDRVALAPKRRGPKPDPAARQVQQLNREIARLHHRLERAELIIDAQKKLCAVLGLPTSDDRTETE
jgi:transposase